MKPYICGRTTLVLFSGVLFGVSAQGCVATRGWVTEQLSPVAERLSQVETRLDQTDTRLAQTDAKTESALSRLDHLRLERRFVLNLKDGTNFAFNSSTLTPEVRQQIDGFLGDLERTEDKIFLVAGYTDSAGSDAYNYELGQKRAASVARYLITRKGLDPLRVSAVSYGESSPVADNTTQKGRSKNRRIELLVYQEAITSSPGEHVATR